MTMPQSTETILALIQKDIANIKGDVNDIKTHLETNYVTKSEFQPIRSAVVGAIGVVLLSVVGALVSLVVLK